MLDVLVVLVVLLDLVVLVVLVFDALAFFIVLVLVLVPRTGSGSSSNGFSQIIVPCTSINLTGGAPPPPDPPTSSDWAFVVELPGFNFQTSRPCFFLPRFFESTLFSSLHFVESMHCRVHAFSISMQKVVIFCTTEN